MTPIDEWFEEWFNTINKMTSMNWYVGFVFGSPKTDLKEAYKDGIEAGQKEVEDDAT